VIERAAITGLVFGWMLQLAIAFLPAAIAGTDGTPSTGFEVAPRPSWASVLAVNLGVAVIWATAVPGLPVASDPLLTAGYGLVALAWGHLVVLLWRAAEEAGEPGGRPTSQPRSERA
jgi:TPP-dependent indolepyruvate ferredoxin oxidoreductase alpha subunit